MFLGHYGLALASKRAAPRASLGTLVLAGNLADCVWPVLLLLGLEKVTIVPGLMAASDLDFESYPWSHSLLTITLLGALFGLGVWAWRKDLRSALVSGALVPAHWLLDLPFHRPDLPLWPGGPKLGFGLWNSTPVTIAAELLSLALGVAVYLRATRATDRTGTFAFFAMIAFMVVVFVSSVGGPPPPGPEVIAWMGLSLWLFVPWAWWIDRHRAPAAAAPVA